MRDYWSPLQLKRLPEFTRGIVICKIHGAHILCFINIYFLINAAYSTKYCHKYYLKDCHQCVKHTAQGEYRLANVARSEVSAIIIWYKILTKSCIAMYISYKLSGSTLSVVYFIVFYTLSVNKTYFFEIYCFIKTICLLNE